MNEKLRQLGKRIIPENLQPIVWKITPWGIHYRRTLNKLRKNILKYYAETDNDSEISDVVNYLSKNKLSVFPYEWVRPSEKVIDDIPVSFDERCGLSYTLLDGKKLFFPADMKVSEIKPYYYGLQEVEQNIESPHRYLTDDFTVEDNSIVIDCGVAEGNFALSIVEKVNKLYLFEPEDRWMKPLQATFEPWKDKVVIVQKYLSDVTDDMNITLDDYFSDKEFPNFLKLDVEGFEERLLNGAEKILSSDSMKKVVTCTYHKQDDEVRLGSILSAHGFSISRSKGYMIFIYDLIQNPPYLRRGLIRASKK